MTDTVETLRADGSDRTASGAAGYKPVLTDKDLGKCGRRWMIASLTYNYATQQALSVVLAEQDALRKVYGKDTAGFKRSLSNCFRYFNITPHMGGLLLGAALAVEDRGHNSSLDAVQDLKVGLMGPLSGVGDTLFGILIPTIMGSISGYMAQGGNIFGALLWLALNIVVYVLVANSWKIGYRFGTSLITTLADKIAAFTEAASVLGLMVVGALIPTVVKINMGLTFTMGEVTLSVQEGILDQILLGMLPIAATAAVYALLKKKVSMNLIIVGIIVFSCVCASFGILAA